MTTLQQKKAQASIDAKWYADQKTYKKWTKWQGLIAGANVQYNNICELIKLIENESNKV